MFRFHLVVVLLFTTSIAATAQWTIQDSHATADLRGIHSIGNGVVWASGTNGTVLRTFDGGTTWQTCSIPPSGEALDFRGIQAFDGETAIVMSSGKGDLSRLYKTTDGCKTWKRVLKNPDEDGFWDAIVARAGQGFLIGDPVANRVVIYSSSYANFEQWYRFGESSSFGEFKFDLPPYEGEEFFAASNSILQGDYSSGITFVSGGINGAYCFSAAWSQHGIGGFPTFSSFKMSIPLAKGPTSGAFSFAKKEEHTLDITLRHSHQHLVAVGGDFQKPNSSSGTAAWSKDGGLHWHATKSPPHGFRSAVAYLAATRTWITVGPNGTDISTDDGRNWRSLKPASIDAPDSDRNWNALSLPFVVGPKGRIGKFRTDAVKP